jgi:photosystem II stability/assembly factor-like uncharacterized protein
MRYLLPISFITIGSLVAIISTAQEHTNNRANSGMYRKMSFEKHQSLSNTSPYKNVQWRQTGPNKISGRCTDVWGIPGNKNVMYAALATSGLWKTEDAGKTWQPLFDKQPTLNFGTIALAPSNPNIIYAGTGEANIFRASLPGMGMFKSIDAGRTWMHIGLENTSTISRVVIHPTNPNVVYVAAGGNEWTNNTERGVFKTTDGGKNWKRILYESDVSGCNDLIMDPTDPNTLYASMWNRVRKRWSDPIPEDGDHIYKSIDSGKTWKPLTNGLPDTKYTGRIGLAMSAKNPNVVYAFIDNHTPKREPKPGELDAYGRKTEIVPMGVQVWRSNDKGESWNKVSTEDDKLERFAGTYGWVFSQIRVDPNNEEVVYIMGVPFAKSVDGGKTFSNIRTWGKDVKGDPVHGDHHAMWIDPTNSDYIIDGNDGGVAVSYDGAKSWKSFVRNMPTTHFYNVTYDMKKPFNIYGSVQDQGSSMGSHLFTYGKIADSSIAWRDAPGGEGTHIALDPIDTNIMYASSFYGRLTKSDLSQPDSMWGRNIGIKKTDAEDPLRGEWMAYTFLSPHDHLTVYHGMQYLFRSKDSGHTWTRISPDLTYNDKNKMGKTPYAINHQAITAADESPLQKGVLYVGTDDGRVWVSKDDGANWNEIVNGLPANSHVSRLVASKYSKGTVYITLSDRREDNITPAIFVSKDFGKTWMKIANNLPKAPVNVVREDPLNKNILYCGTDIGIYISKNSGADWQSLRGNLPAALSIQDLFIHPRDNKLVIGTYGRGVWILDDISILQK